MHILLRTLRLAILRNFGSIFLLLAFLLDKSRLASLMKFGHDNDFFLCENREQTGDRDRLMTSYDDQANRTL